MSRVIRFRDYSWEGVERKEYKSPAPHFRDISRQTLLGEGEGEQSLNFITRYFEIEPGGYSSLERHEHPHAVIVLRGCGTVVLGESAHGIEPFDVVFVSPGAFHQFHASPESPLGFLCIVDRTRDRPELPSDEEFDRLASNPLVARLLRR
jgi:quercetin dioxygenase-like cupin family protein